MSDQTNPPSDPTPPPDALSSPSFDTQPVDVPSVDSAAVPESAEAGEVPAPEPQRGYDAPPPPEASAPGTFGAPPPAGPAGYPPPPQANPYGGYTSAPPPSAQYGGQVAVGSLPYVEHHFGPVTSFGDRIVPGLIDAALTLIGLIPMIIGIIVMAASAGSGAHYDDSGNYTYDGSNDAGMAIGLLLLFGSFVVFLGIWIWNRIFKMGRTGQSVGKKVAGQMLINTTSGQPIGPGQSFVREIIHGLANQVVYLSYLWMLWDPNRQTLGDMVAKSAVIKVPKA